MKRPARRTSSPSGRKKINLALQGGGAHGAFAWGVIDRLLEDDRLEIDGIVGTSAGAMNAAVTACGLAEGGPAAAREKLYTFWNRISEGAKNSPLQPSMYDRMFKPGSLDTSPGYYMLDSLSRMMSPYQLNPMNLNPLRDVLYSVVDCDVLHHQDKVKLFICASNVLTGKIKVFNQDNVSVESVLASACLPFMFQAVEVGGEFYWDGGYMGNPPLYPLIYHCGSRDVLIVQLNPIRIPEVPKTAQAIMDRINTLSFNSSLMREMRAINFVTKLIESGFDDNGRLKRMLIHTVDAEEEVCQLGVSSKLNADWSFLTSLHEIGRQKADEFLARHFDDVGTRSSTDIEEKFLDGAPKIAPLRKSRSSKR
ncbi:MAG: patatin-like phospholipase family protein [Alphaproteobacteria bacterium]|nr:patatin-like phospholipase family protein [Alphaproteobacteria bacterium]